MSVNQIMLRKCYLLLGRLLGSLLSSRLLSLLGSRFLGLLGCRLLSSLWLLGLLGSRLLGLLGSGLLSLLGLGLLSGQLVAASSLSASSSSSHDSLGGGHLPQGELDTDSSLGSVHLVVGNDSLQDGLAGGALLVSQLLDGSLDHGGIGRVGSRLGSLLGLRLSSSSHDCGVDMNSWHVSAPC